MATRSEKPRNKVSPRGSQQERGPEGASVQEASTKRTRSPRNASASAGASLSASIGPKVSFGREVCGNLEAAEAREWLVTNGIGVFASGTIAGCMTRRYHGLLIAALQPPVGRTHLVAGVDETVRYSGAEYRLGTYQWGGGVVDPKGFLNIQSFRLEGMTPVWTYALADALLEKRVWMQHGENTTYVKYTLLRSSGAIEMEFKALVNYRDFHSSTHAGDWHMEIDPVEHGVKVTAFDRATPFYLQCEGAECEARHEWYRGYFLPVEKERGLDDSEDHLFAALFRTKLSVGKSVTFVATTEDKPSAGLDGDKAAEKRVEHEAALLQTWLTGNGKASECPS